MASAFVDETYRKAATGELACHQHADRTGTND
jgi:hypothetical protein